MSQHRSVIAAAISLSLFAGGCKTAGPAPNAPVQSSSPEDERAASEDPTPQQASGSGEAVEPVESKNAVESVAEKPAQHPPEDVAVLIEVSADRLSIAGDAILSLDQGFVAPSGFRSQRYFEINGIVEPVEEALVVERRRRVVAGEDVGAMRALVHIEASTPADTLLGLQYTLGRTELAWLTFEIDGHEPVHVQLDDDFISRRVTPFQDRRPEGSGDGEASSEDDQTPTVSNRRTILGSIGSSGQGTGGIGLIGLGRGGGGFGSGLGTKASRPNTVPPAGRCDATAQAATQPLALTHAAVRLAPNGSSTWLSGRHRSSPRYHFEEIAIEPAASSVDDYPWWKLYNELARMRRYYGEAQTLLIWPHPSLSAEIVLAASQVNCKLPKDSYASKEAWEEARAKREEQADKQCEPMFRWQVLANGNYPDS